MCLRRVIGPLPSGVYLFKNGDGDQQNNALDRQGLQHRPEERETTIPPNGVQRADDPGNPNKAVIVNARLPKIHTSSIQSCQRSQSNSPRTQSGLSPTASRYRLRAQSTINDVGSATSRCTSPDTSSKSDLGTNKNTSSKPSLTNDESPFGLAMAQAKLSPPPSPSSGG